MIRLVLCLLLFPAITSYSQVEDLNWPIGKWRTVLENGQYSEETWTRSPDGNYEGTGVLVENGDTLFQEHMFVIRIYDSWFFRADLQNQAPVLFTLEVRETNHWIFTNSEHDYPQRIEYSLIDELHLNATVSLLDGGNPNSWEFIKQH